MKTIKEIKKEIESELNFSLVGSQKLFLEKLINRFKEYQIEELKKAFDAGLRYGIYCQGGSHDQSDNVDLEEYLKTLTL